jgi:cell fate regulator YaaT (PSP1 superfamily)
MGCGTCSTNTGSVSAGCKSNGTCGTSGCNKLNVYDWLAGMQLPENQKPFNIIEVQFKGTRKEYFRNTEYLPVRSGDMVAVEGTPGHDIGTVTLTGELVKLQLNKHKLNYDSAEIRQMYRVARSADIEKYNSIRAQEVKTMYKARVIAGELGLKMKLSDVEYQGDGKKAIFYYSAEERVDFRELIKRLAVEFHIRIEMKQIGLRQEAGRLGGIGVCGRELCCSTWLTDFKVVSTSAARYQNLAINPVKLAGQCGKLKCCLNYELESYMDALRDIPDSSINLFTEKGKAIHRKTDIFRRFMWYEIIPQLPEGEKYFSNADNWIMLSVDRVKEIIALNKTNQKPADLKDENEEEEVVIAQPDYSDVVGQDSITRLDHKKKKKKKKKHNRPRGDNRQLPSPNKVN